ncbi:glycosyltransferase [Seohaeicola saemankumensis]|nr:glycosyltransferase [Seohaeicola saemankumensis]MCA0872820.1 glycosyltransferase [Seohaeicola saemankumensis]
MITVIIPAYNEEHFIGETLSYLLASEPTGGPVQVVVVANGCIDKTVQAALALENRFAEKGWQLEVLDLPEGSKTRALNAGDTAARYDKRVYVDADVHVSPPLIAGLARALDCRDPAYAGGRPRIRPAASLVSQRYARFWERLPFMATGVPGCGVYAVNAAGRARWGVFPDIISDDTFVRYHFSTNEMHAVDATYSWPITEGFGALVRVRRRQDLGLAELHATFPDLAASRDRTAPDASTKLARFLSDPIGFVIYAAVAVTVRSPLFGNRTRWERGR